MDLGVRLRPRGERSLTLNSHIGLPRRCSTVRTKGGVEASRCDSVRLSRLVTQRALCGKPGRVCLHSSTIATYRPISARLRAAGSRRTPQRVQHTTTCTLPQVPQTGNLAKAPSLLLCLSCGWAHGRAASAHSFTRASLRHDGAYSHSFQLVHKARQERAIMASQVIPVSFSEVVNVRRALSPLAQRALARTS